MKYIIVTGTKSREVIKQAAALLAEVRMKPLIWPETEGIHPLCPTDTIERVMEFIAGRDTGMIVTLSEHVILMFQAMIEEGLIPGGAVEIWDEDGFQELDNRGHFIHPVQLMHEWEVGFHLRFSRGEVVQGLKAYPAFAAMRDIRGES